MDEDESIQGSEALLVSDAPLGFQPVGVATSTPPLVVASRERDSNAHVRSGGDFRPTDGPVTPRLSGLHWHAPHLAPVTRTPA
jgi:hypothetical protein